MSAPGDPSAAALQSWATRGWGRRRHRKDGLTGREMGAGWRGWPPARTVTGGRPTRGPGGPARSTAPTPDTEARVPRVRVGGGASFLFVTASGGCCARPVVSRTA